MNDLIIGGIAVTSAIISGCAVYSIGWVDRLEKQIAALEQSVKKLTDAQAHKEHTCSTSAGLLDAMAVIMDVQDNMEITRLRLDKARKILGTTHDGPHAYGIDEPAGLRPAKKAK